MSKKTETGLGLALLFALVITGVLGLRIVAHECPKTPCPKVKECPKIKKGKKRKKTKSQAPVTKPYHMTESRPSPIPRPPQSTEESEPDGAMVTLEAIEHDTIEELEAMPEEKEVAHAIVDEFMRAVDQDLMATAVASDVSLMSLAMTLLDDKEFQERELLGSKRAAWLKQARENDINGTLNDPDSIFAAEWKMIQGKMGVAE